MKGKLFMLLTLVAGVMATGMSHRPGQTALASPTATCDTPVTETIRGMAVEFDDCALLEFTHDEVDYVIRVYYTEVFQPPNADDPNGDVNYEACATEDVDDPLTRCEHALPSTGAGDNAYAVQVANEVEGALRFYIDHNMKPMPTDGTDFYMYIAEDPKNGWIVEPDGIIMDDEKVETSDVVELRGIVYHEMQHLIQKQHANNNWNLWYTEGLARAIEDRADPDLDAALGAFITDSKRMLRNSDDHDLPRENDLMDASYRAVVWWTWVLDQYRDPAEVAPVQGWLALQDFYDEIATGADSLSAADNFLNDQGSSFHADFIDYTLAMYAYQYNPSDPRLGFLDQELIAETSLQNHTVIDTPPANWFPVFVLMNPRSSRYWEFVNASACDYTGFTFSSSSEPYAFSLLTVDNGTLNGRWTVFSHEWARTVRSTDLERVAGVVTAVDSSGVVGVTYGCASPSISILDPTTTSFKMVGTADNPRTFIVQLAVTDENGGPVAGLVPDAFSVEINDGSGPIPADVVNAAYVQDYYWLVVQAPGAADGAQTGVFYDLTITLDDYDSDTQANALLYVEQTQDKVLVLDRSGSMADNGKLAAAQNAATLMVNELSDDDQGGYVAFDDNGALREPLNGMDAAGHRQDLETAIGAETPGGNTSIGDGMFEAAEEHDANGLAENACTFVLLSDGYENAEAYWADVQNDVVDNGCALDVIAFGPQANEELLQSIAGASGASGDSGYDYAPDSGDVTFNTAGGEKTIGWENNLSRLYDYMTTVAAGRQRIFSDVYVTNVDGAQYSVQVDETTVELVVAVGWQTPDTDVTISLYDPNNNELPDSLSRMGSTNTNLVWRVPEPVPGTYTLVLRGVDDDAYVSASARTDLHLYWFHDKGPGMEGDPNRPIIVGFVYNAQPVIGGAVTAWVTAPDGERTKLTLYDDGAHGDMLVDDGVYGNVYPIVTDGELVSDDPTSYAEGAAPASVGSYAVEIVGVWNGHRREAQGSFSVPEPRDTDGDGLPDLYEEKHGLDPNDPDDGREDPDGDGLWNLCEFEHGLDPFNSDTDNGGEHDGSELRECRPGDKDPRDPSDDRAGHYRGLLVSAEADSTGPYMVLNPLGWIPVGGAVPSATLYRRDVTPDGTYGDWTALHTITDPANATYRDDTVQDGQLYQYLVVPHFELPDSTTVDGRAVQSRIVAAKNDPYPPDGSIVINQGALTTPRRLVTLSIVADDRLPDHGDLSEAPRPGDGTDDLLMRLSNSPDFEGVAWQPYQPTVSNWDLGDVEPGTKVSVYVQFKDTSGNVGADGLGQVDSIVYAPVIYLPTIIKP